MSANDRGNEPTDEATSSSRQRPARPVATARREIDSVDPREELAGKRPPSRGNTNAKRRPSSGSSPNGAGSNRAGANGAPTTGAGSNGSRPNDAAAIDAAVIDAAATETAATARREIDSVDPREELLGKRPPSRANTNSKRRPSSRSSPNGSAAIDAAVIDAAATETAATDSTSTDAAATDAATTDATAIDSTSTETAATETAATDSTATETAETVIPEIGLLAPVEMPDRPAGPVKPRARQKPPRTTANPAVPGRPEGLVDPTRPSAVPMPMPVPIVPPDRFPIQPSHLAPVPQPIVIHPAADDYPPPPLQFDETDLEPEGPPPARRVPGLSPGGRRTRPRVRRVTRVVRHVDPWSVFKVALCFSMVLYGVCLTAGVLLWNVAYTTGTIDNMQRFFESFGWTSFRFKGGELFHNAWIAGLFAAVGLTGLIVLAATLFNLITDLVGGIRVTVLEEEVVERNPAVRQPLPRRRSSEMFTIRTRRPGDDDGFAGDDTIGPTRHQPG